MIAYRRIMTLSLPKRQQLAAVMACDGEESRYKEFLRWLADDFARIDRSSRTYIVAEDDGVIVGFVRLWLSPYLNEWVNDGMVVAPDYRRQGIGTQLVRLILGLAWDLGAPSVIAHIGNQNVPSIRLHEKAGFRREPVSAFKNSYGTQQDPGRGGRYRVLRPGPSARRVGCERKANSLSTRRR
jgi:RimJ/RimL family protein N-acetyltransferase